MRLRVTTEAPTYAFATSPVNFGGLTQEDLLFFIVPLVIVSKTTGENLWAFAVAFSACGSSSVPREISLRAS